MLMNRNIHPATVDGFGDEWKRFDQSMLSSDEHQYLFNLYFSIFPWDQLSSDSKGFDLGCGSGRWAKLVAPRVGTLHCIDPSSALEIAKKNLVEYKNCEFHLSSVDEILLSNNSMDFGYSLGVLHHVPDTQAALISCVQKLKIGAPFLIYLYYNFDNKPFWFRKLWETSNLMRRVISKLPYFMRYSVSQLLATTIYFPLAKLALILDKAGLNIKNFPLNYYKKCSFYTMRTDALDRFGTCLEQRFTRKEIQSMMEKAGLERITFSSEQPYWCAIGYRKDIS